MRRPEIPSSYLGPAVCATCRHPEAASIDAARVKGGTLRSLAQQFGIGRMSLSRHFKNHLPARVRAAARAHRATPADDILERLRDLHDETREILAEARASKDPESALKAIARLERQLELEGRLLGIGELAPASGGTTVNIVTLDAETGRRVAQIYLQRHGAPQPALPPSPIELEAMEAADTDAERVKEGE